MLLQWDMLYTSYMQGESPLPTFSCNEVTRGNSIIHIKTHFACRGSHKHTWGNFLKKPTSKARFAIAPVAQKGRFCLARLFNQYVVEISD